MNANEIEIICLCGDHISLVRVENSDIFIGYCIGCDRHWSLESAKK